MKNKINILFVCGYGVGSSAISETVVKKALNACSISSELKHTSVGEMSQFKDWSDIICISKKLAEGVDLKSYSDKDVLEIVNIMDGKTIAKDIEKIVLEKYPDAKS
ncbi:hypothetical protein BRSU_2679 [Brachyspira suanatina]|uniref:Phosphotransferase system EIIB component type 2/3 domain-containing protein n=1 Tax=Brachyspira suanatina TaxID=381802 RepID=A0A0G4KAT8_9SPIR|nr:hypothetical protein [Brachyspira suanatina]CRF35473.1 hypothetical protein BRSU_2679 [Brachyspira suanatina]